MKMKNPNIIIVVLCLIREGCFGNTMLKPKNCGESLEEGVEPEYSLKDYMKVRSRIIIRGENIPLISEKNGFIELNCDSLDLAGNNIQAIRVGAFNNSSIKDLILSNNQITCSLKNQLEVEDLVNLDISNNRITYIQNDALPETLRKLTLNFNWLSEFEINHSLKNMKELYLTGNRLINLKLDAESARKLERLDLGYNKLQQFNFSGLVNLKYLILKSNNLDYLDSNSFLNLENLLELDISQNKLEHLDIIIKNAFPQLVKLNIEGNYIQRIQNNVFWNTANLGELDLSGNFLREFNFTNNYLKKVWRLKMNYINLNRIDPSRFQNLDTLFELELSHNQIQHFNSRFNIPTLWRLDLSHNGIAKINNHFGNLRELGSLDLSYNRMISFNINNNNLDKIWKIKLNHNELVEIPDHALPNLNFLLLLDISNNNLNNFIISADKLQRLRILDLSFNNIFIYDDIFQSYMSLKFLSLRNNFIRSVDPAIFYKQSKLYYLDLSHNLITFFKYGKKYTRSSLSTFNIFGNPINCKHLKEMEYYCFKNHIRMNICDSHLVGDGHTPSCVDYRCDCEYRPDVQFDITDSYLEIVPKYDVKNCSFDVLAHNGA